MRILFIAKRIFISTLSNCNNHKERRIEEVSAQEYLEPANLYEKIDERRVGERSISGP